MRAGSNGDAGAAGPWAGRGTEPGLRAAVKPGSRSKAPADRAAVGSGPNSEAYVCGETVCPDAINLARRAGSRTFKPKLSDTVPASPAGPRGTAFRMAAARLVGGRARREIPAPCAAAWLRFAWPRTPNA